MESCFHLSTTSTKTSAFQSHHHFISSKKKQSANLVTLLFPPQSLHFPSTSHNTRTHLIICRAKNAVEEVPEVTDNTWKELIIDSSIPALVQFWAPSCGPCKVVEPIICDIAKEYAGKVACYKINTDDCLKMASQYGIKSIPTVLLFKNGEQIECLTGAVRKNILSNALEKYL